jgi:hypothetical protein
MIGVKAEEAERFYEEDEDPVEVFATFDAAKKGRTAPPTGQHPVPRRFARLRHEIAAFLHRMANIIEQSPSRTR